MATRSYLIQKEGNNYQVVYCHFDGYPERMMPLLREYNTPELAKALFSLGDLSILEETLETTVAYHRDRGEDLAIHLAPTWQDALVKADTQYRYIYEPSRNKWYWMSYGFTKQGYIEDIEYNIDEGDDPLDFDAMQMESYIPDELMEGL